MNKLSASTSPYLLQHAHNPVEWNLWDEETLERARSEDKPIFLSIGYAACHWCHVMAHESFEDQETARILNENFIPIKVDREERPDLDSIYMKATTAITGQGGWPMSVFLTPDLKPFYAGTYFPPVRRYHMPAFKEVLAKVVFAYRFRRQEVERAGKGLIQSMQSNQWSISQEGMSDRILASAAENLIDHYDWENGGWGAAPKFPQPMSVEFLLRQASRGNEKARETALHCLKAMARGGMYDVVGGGFARYSVDSSWRTPHFEKMLYDNAQLAQVYLHAWQFTKDEFFKRTASETLEFVEREMTNPQGGFFSSLDADSEGEEGKYYVWTKTEIREALNDEMLWELFETAYDVGEEGNWEGKTVLQRAQDDEILEGKFNLTHDEVIARLSECRTRLLAARERRVRPNTDDKALTAWNGLMLAAFAEAGRSLDAKYTTIAQRNADFLLHSLRPQGQLRRSWREGRATDQVFLEDYAALILGLIELYQTDFDVCWYTSAVELTQEMIARFEDRTGDGFFDVPGIETSVQSDLIYRPKELQDNATPSGNALAAEALLKLAAFAENASWRDLAEKTLEIAAKGMERYPSSFGCWLSASDFAWGPVKQVAVIGDLNQMGTQSLLKEIRSTYRPRLVIACSSLHIDPQAPELLKDRPMLEGKPTVYVCEGFVCRQPATEVEALREVLRGEGFY